jgi:uncharacterized protein YdeI (YjbR/CyaY-like superfamily)
MGKRSAEFDLYIAKAAPFAQPILKKIRDLFHKACPDIEEVMKWSFPHFEYKGIVGSMAAFKNHLSFGFWKGSLMKDRPGAFSQMGKTSMSRADLRDVAELPPDKVFLEYIREAVQLNEEEIKAPVTRKKKPPLEVPDYFLAALKKNKKALATFEAFPVSQKREYVEWLTEAKQETTRTERLATALEWLAAGKPRMWKYMQKKT